MYLIVALLELGPTPYVSCPFTENCTAYNNNSSVLLLRILGPYTFVHAALTYNSMHNNFSLRILCPVTPHMLIFY